MPCRITNTAKEVYQSLGKDINEVKIDSYETLLPSGERGVLESTVTRTFLEALNDEEIDLQETEYWFNPTKDDYVDDTLYLPAEEVEPTFPEPYHADAADCLEIVGNDGQIIGVERIPLDMLQEAFEGETLTGIVTDVWLYHGLQVDVGAKYDGLIPITIQEFEHVADRFQPGQMVEVQICSMKRPGLYRWPLVLRFMDTEIAPLITDPDEYHNPINHAWAYAQGWELQDLMRETGRSYEPTSVYMREDDALTAMAMQEAMGDGIDEYLDGARSNPAIEELADHRQPQVDDVAGRLMGA